MEVLKRGLEKVPKSGELLIALVELLLGQGRAKEAEERVEEARKLCGRGDSVHLYLRGQEELRRENGDEAYILFEECLKFNNNRTAVTRAFLEILIIEIGKRDFYKAYHTIGRSKFFEIEAKEEIEIYSQFIEAAILMIKKKYSDSNGLLAKVLANKKAREMKLADTVLKYLGYGFFKLGEHSLSIKHYKKLDRLSLDESSTYNMVLAEGIQLVDKEGNFEGGIKKFNEAKKVYPQKVEPYLYLAMTYIKRANAARDGEAHLTQAAISALRCLEEGYELNSGSSNLLYHRTILHLYF